jgi:hypothetical protein
MSSANTTNQVALLKRLYPQGVAKPLYERCKFLADVKKDTNFGGEGAYVNITISGTAGGSADFATALANMDATIEKRWFVTHRKEYQLFSIQGDAIARSKGDKNAIMQILTRQIDGARYGFARAMAARAYGGAGGQLGIISAASTVASANVTLTTPANVVSFEANGWVMAATDDGTGTSPAAQLPGHVQISALDRSPGSATFGRLTTAGGNWSTQIPGLAAGTGRLFRDGDYGLAMTGAQGWAPVADPSASESFFGMDRTVGDVVRQSGCRYNGNGGSKEETLISAAAAGQMVGSHTIKRVYVNPLDYAPLIQEMGTKRIIDNATREPNVGYKGVEVDTPAGTWVCTSEPDVPKGYAWAVDPDDITLATAGECPMFLNEDGVGNILRAAADDAYQGRLGAYGNFKWMYNTIPVIIQW